MLQDIATLTGGKVVSEDVGVKLENVAVSDLGRARRVVITKDDTTIVEGAGKKADIQGRCTQIRGEIEKTSSNYDREKLEERLARLSGGVAVIKVGAATEAEMKEKKDRVDDALHATRAAAEEGILPGGGVSYIRAARALKQQGFSGDEAVGAEIVRRALDAPLRTIADNAGVEASLIVQEVKENKGAWGYDAARREYTDLVAAGVIDPTKVVRVALQNAASVAGLLLTTEAIVTDEPEKTHMSAGAGDDDFGD
jgi:chaperonin GroEL